MCRRFACKHQRSPRKICCAAECCNMLQAVGGDYQNFPKATEVKVQHSKRKRGKSSWTVCPCHCLGCFRLINPGVEQETFQPHMHHLTTLVVAISDNWLLKDGIDIWVRYIPQKILVYCGMLRHASKPTNSPQKQVLQHAAACFNRWCLFVCMSDLPNWHVVYACPYFADLGFCALTRNLPTLDASQAGT